MSETKPKKGSSNRRATEAVAVDVLDKAPDAAFGEGDAFDDLLGEIAGPAKADDLDDILSEIAAPVKADAVDDLDDILGEIAGPVKADAVDDLDDILGEIAGPAKVDPVDDFDDILGEVAGPAKADPVDDFDDILGEIAGPAKADPVDDFDDILGEIAGPAKVDPIDDFDDILGQIAGPAPAAAVDDFDDILSELSGPAPVESDNSLDAILGEMAPPAPAAVVEEKPKGSRKRPKAEPEPEPVSTKESDDFNAMMDEMAPMTEAVAPAASASPGAENVDDAAVAPKKPGILAKVLKLGGAASAPFKGKKEISRVAFAGLLGTIGVLGTAVIGQATYIMARPASGHGGGHEPAPAVSIVPVDYSKVDLGLYRDKVRALHEGGRDMLRNPAIKQAVLNLESGEQLYADMREMARRSAAADRVDIRDDRVTILSCGAPQCGVKNFKLVYSVQNDDAIVCMNDRYEGGASSSYSYGPDGYSEQPSCDAIH